MFQWMSAARYTSHYHKMNNTLSTNVCLIGQSISAENHLRDPSSTYLAIREDTRKLDVLQELLHIRSDHFFTPILHLQLLGKMVHLPRQRKELSFIKSVIVPFRASFKDKKGRAAHLGWGGRFLARALYY